MEDAGTTAGGQGLFTRFARFAGFSLANWCEDTAFEGLPR